MPNLPNRQIYLLDHGHGLTDGYRGYGSFLVAIVDLCLSICVFFWNFAYYSLVVVVEEEEGRLHTSDHQSPSPPPGNRVTIPLTLLRTDNRYRDNITLLNSSKQSRYHTHSINIISTKFFDYHLTHNSRYNTLLLSSTLSLSLRRNWIFPFYKGRISSNHRGSIRPSIIDTPFVAIAAT